jgi:hypothetical protein
VGWHTVEIRVAGDPAARPRVDVDAFLVAAPVGSDGAVDTVLEAEELPTWTSTTTIVPQTEVMIPRGSAEWSGGRQLLWAAAGPVATLRIPLPFGHRGSYRVTVYPTQGPEYGQARFFIEGHGLARQVDLYAPSTAPAEPVLLGAFDEWGPSSESLVVTVAGRNSDSAGYWVGIDRIVITPVH